MGATSSLLDGKPDANELANLTEQQRTNLRDVGFLLDAYDIKTGQDLTALYERSTKKKAEVSHGFELINRVASRNKPGEDFANVVEEARSRVRVLMRQVSQEKFTNFMVGLDGSKPSNNAYEVNCLFTPQLNKHTVLYAKIKYRVCYLYRWYIQKNADLFCICVLK
jgi:hypothetical protein